MRLALAMSMNSKPMPETLVTLVLPLAAFVQLTAIPFGGIVKTAEVKSFVQLMLVTFIVRFGFAVFTIPLSPFMLFTEPTQLWSNC